MMLGIGTDIVAVERFVPWVDYPEHRLLRVFTPQEIIDCRDARGNLVAEKLAVRFAAKEAFYKALSLTFVNLRLSFELFSLLSVCRLISVSYGLHGVPVLVVDWEALEKLGDVKVSKCVVHVSLAHERAMALAFVIIEQRV